MNGLLEKDLWPFCGLESLFRSQDPIGRQGVHFTPLESRENLSLAGDAGYDKEVSGMGSAVWL